jgi:hypothetical protein
LDVGGVSIALILGRIRVSQLVRFSQELPGRKKCLYGPLLLTAFQSRLCVKQRLFWHGKVHYESPGLYWAGTPVAVANNNNNNNNVGAAGLLGGASNNNNNNNNAGGEGTMASRRLK